MTRLKPGTCLFGMSCDNDTIRLRDFGYPGVPVDGIRDYGNDDQLKESVAALGRKQVPWVSFKVGSWGSAAGGSQDSALTAKFRILARAAKANDTDVLISFHHEYLSTPSSPTGEGGSSTDFWRMQDRLSNLAYRVFSDESARPYCKPLLCANGWTGRPRDIGGTRGLTDAQKQEWLLGPNNLGVTLFEGRLGGDYYRKPGENNMPSSDQFPHVEAWAKKVGYTSLFVGEYAAPDDTVGLQELARQAEIFWRPGTPWGGVYYWNSDGTAAQFGLDVGTNRMNAIRAHAQIAAAFNAQAPDPDPEEPPVDPPVDPPTDPKDAEIADLKRQLALALEAGDRADQVADEQRARAEAAETRAAGLQAEKNALTDERDRLVGAVRNMVQLGSSVLPA